MIDIIQTLGQLSKLVSDTRNLMRIPHEIVMNGPPDEDEEGVNGQDAQKTPSIANSLDTNNLEEGKYYDFLASLYR